jgi:Flp pilus assembly protein CpaB
MTYRVRNILIALGLAVLAAVLVSIYVTSYKRDVQSSEEAVEVLVATRDIPAGTPGEKVVAGSYLAPKDVARRAVVPGAVSSPGQIEKLVASQPVYAGEQVTVRRFTPLKEQGVGGQLKGTLRAIQVSGDGPQLLAGTLKAGDRVDVVAAFQYKIDSVEYAASRVVLRDLLVLRGDEADAAAKITAGPQGGHSVVLALTDAQAQKLMFAKTQGEWALQLRPVIDSADSPEGVETYDTILGDGLKAQRLEDVYTGRAHR